MQRKPVDRCRHGREELLPQVNQKGQDTGKVFVRLAILEKEKWTAFVCWCTFMCASKCVHVYMCFWRSGVNFRCHFSRSTLFDAMEGSSL